MKKMIILVSLSIFVIYILIGRFFLYSHSINKKNRIEFNLPDIVDKAILEKSGFELMSDNNLIEWSKEDTFSLELPSGASVRDLFHLTISTTVTGYPFVNMYTIEVSPSSDKKIMNLIKVMPDSVIVRNVEQHFPHGMGVKENREEIYSIDPELALRRNIIVYEDTTKVQYYISNPNTKNALVVFWVRVPFIVTFDSLASMF